MAALLAGVCDLLTIKIKKMLKSCLSLFVIITLVGLVPAHEITVLTDADFESKTKASLGGTTEDWLVLFCSPNRFRACREIMPLWQEAADEFYG